MNIELRLFCICGNALTAKTGTEPIEIMIEPCPFCKDKARTSGVDAAISEIEALKKRRGLPF